MYEIRHKLNIKMMISCKPPQLSFMTFILQKFNKNIVKQFKQRHLFPCKHEKNEIFQGTGWQLKVPLGTSFNVFHYGEYHHLYAKHSILEKRCFAILFFFMSAAVYYKCVKRYPAR